MASTPTTKSQVQAYRFVLRRMESALVRKDPVMLHDPMRSHKRATMIGVVVGVVGLLGFMIVGILKADPTVPTSGIVLAQPSGQVYVVSSQPHQLIPVFNLASARLLLMAASSQNNQNGQSGAGAAQSSSSSSQGPASVTVVSDDQLKGIPMGRLTGIPDGPSALPGPSSAPTNWAVCDKVQRDPNAPQNSTPAAPQTTVLVGQPNIGTELQEGQALLVKGPNGQTYLIYHRQHNLNDENDSEVRALVDTTDSAVNAALGLNTTQAQSRTISGALLDAIPLVGEIKNPLADLTGMGQPGFNGMPVPVGQSFSVQNADGTRNYYVSVHNGRQQVSETVAQIIRFENSGSQQEIQGLRPDQVDPVPVQTDGLQVDVTNYPGKVPAVFNIDTKPVVCLGWSTDLTDPQKPIAKTQVTVDFDIEMPMDASSGSKMTPVQIGQPAAGGKKIDYFFMNPVNGMNQGLTVRSASNPNEFANGPIVLVSARGVQYSVQDLATAQGLGLANTNAAPWGVFPAPSAIVGLLPSSSETLNTANVQRTFDTMPMPQSAGVYMTPTAQPGG